MPITRIQRPVYSNYNQNRQQQNDYMQSAPEIDVDKYEDETIPF